MADKTAIEWTDATWNPVTGCTKVSPGCDHCYAETLAERFRGTPGHPYENGFDLTLRPERLTQPLRWTRPRRIFVNSMSDLFHDDIPDDFIAKVFAVMALAPQHTFQVLTKRHGRMRSLLNHPDFKVWVALAAMEHDVVLSGPWPLPNVWLGVSVEDQQRADLRIPALLETSAAVRWLSMEPLLGPVDLTGINWRRGSITHLDVLNGRYGVPALWQQKTDKRIDWVVVGGESGHGARPMHPDWALSLRDQCVEAGVPYLFKQHGEWEPIGPLYPLGDDDPDPYDDAHMEAVHLEVIEKRTVVQLERDGYIAEGHQPGDPRTWLMARVGKKRAGRVLDGRTWDEYPAVANA